MKPTVSALLLLAISLASMSGQDSTPGPAPVEEKKISAEALYAAEELIDCRNVDDQMVQAMTTMMESMKVEPELKKALMAELTKQTNLDELKRSMAESYARRLSAEDLRAMTAFYLTPAGRRIAEQEAAINADSMKAGQEWGSRLGTKVDKELQKKSGQPEKSQQKDEGY